MSTVECKCKQCKQIFTARVADRKRGWARFCSKSCKAKKQVKTMAYDSVSKRSFKSKVAKKDFIQGGRANTETMNYINPMWVDDKNNYGSIVIDSDDRHPLDIQYY